MTLHQWKVYDAVKSVPYGKVASYDVIAKMLGSSPRAGTATAPDPFHLCPNVDLHCDSGFAVGNALRRNPFAPYIPCHRVITSRGYIGGFFGEWGLPGNAEGKREKAGMVVKGDGTVVRKKLEVSQSSRALEEPRIDLRLFQISMLGSGKRRSRF